MVNQYRVLDTTGMQYYISRESYQTLSRDLMNAHPFVKFVAEWSDDATENVLLHKDHIVRINEVQS